MPVDDRPISVRSAEMRDEPFLWECLVLAAYAGRIDAAVAVPELAKYVVHWGERAGDVGVIAERVGLSVGAAWARLFSLAERPYVYGDERTPEIAIGVLPEHRNQRIGAMLLEALVMQTRRAGLSGLCLSVREDNPAVRHYERFGFRRIDQRETRREGHTSFGMALAFATADRSETAADAVR